MFKFLILTYLGFFLTVVQSFAFEIPDNENQIVFDQGRVFSANEVRSIEKIITDIENETTVEIAVWTVPTLEGYPIFNAALEAGRKWGVGQKENDNGVVLLVAVQDRDWFMATGYGVEGALPDVLVKRIGERHFPPNFRNDNYGQGIRLALLDIKALLKEDPTVIAEYKETSKAVLWSLHLSVAASLFLLSIYRKRKNLLAGIFVSGFVSLHFLALAGGMLFGGAGLLFYFLMVGFYSLFAFSSELKGNGGSGGERNGGGWSSGGGFSSGGFGGGSFGGGGSGGKW